MNRKQLRQALGFVVDGLAPPAARSIGQAKRMAALKSIHAWSRHSSIQGFGIAQRHDRRSKGDLALKVYIDWRRPAGSPDAVSIPPTINVPGLRNPVPVDVEAIGRLRLQVGTNGLSNPQISISRLGGGPGTAGCIVAKPGSSDRYLLSNAHVMAWHGESAAKAGDPIICPAVDAGGNPQTDVIATLEDWSPREGDADTGPRFDAAIARLRPDLQPGLAQAIGIPIASSTAIIDGMPIQYCGAKSGAKTAKVKDSDFHAQLTLEAASGGQQQFTFNNVVMCEPSCAEGDSGSAVYRPGNPPFLVGLIMAGSVNVSVFCRIEHVFKHFGLAVAKDVHGGQTATPPASASAAPPPTPTPLAVPQPGAASSGLAIDRVTVDLVVQAFDNPSIHDNIATHLPLVLQALRERNLTDAAMIGMCLGTIRAEASAFAPVSEGISKFNSSDGTASTAFDLYDHRLADLGNLGPPDGRTYRGRGLVQLTGRFNYRRYGQMIGLGDALVDHPELANDPTNAARLLAAFLFDHLTKIRDALADNDMTKARKAVDGGVHGLAEFTMVYRRCIDLL